MRLHFLTHTTLDIGDGLSSDEISSLVDALKRSYSYNPTFGRIQAITAHRGDLPDFEYGAAAASPQWAFPEALDETEGMPPSHVRKLVADGIRLCQEADR